MTFSNFSLTNPSSMNFALSNDFTDSFMLKVELEDCATITEAEEIINKYSSYRKWKFKLDTKTKTIFESKDSLGNIHYFVLYKKED